MSAEAMLAFLTKMKTKAYVKLGFVTIKDMESFVGSPETKALRIGKMRQRFSVNKDIHMCDVCVLNCNPREV